MNAKLLFLTATLIPSLASQASILDCHGDIPGSCVTAETSLEITFAPTILVGMTLSGREYDKALVKLAAVDAAAYLAGGGIGANLQVIVNDNPTESLNTLVDAVLKVADQL